MYDNDLYELKKRTWKEDRSKNLPTKPVLLVFNKFVNIQNKMKHLIFITRETFVLNIT